ncbi:MAG: DUF4139 domain-containing protein [Gammaproteobacteria bacterium]|jgi:hypothetical protein
MNRSLPPLALLALLAACSRGSDEAPPARPAEPAPAENAQRGASRPAAETHLTVYSGGYEQVVAGHRDLGYALVRSESRYALQAGANAITIGRLPRGIDVAAVGFRPLEQGVTVGAQRFIAPFDGADGVLARALGRRVAIEHTSGGAKQTDNGTLVAIGDSLTLALADGRYKVIREYDSLSVLEADDLPGAEPQLRWEVQAPRAGNAGFRLTYPTTGLAWRAEYVARIAAGDDCRLVLDAAALVANHSGVSYPNAQLTLVAGEPARVRGDDGMPKRAATPEADMAMPVPAPEPRRSGEYHAYDLPGRAMLANGAVERVPLLPQAPAVACERTYLTRPAAGVWTPPQPLTDPGLDSGTGPQPVRVAFAVANTEQAGLGRPLPAGRMRVLQGEELLGESQLPHTPAGAELRMEIGTAFDLTAERERTGFNLDRGGRTMTESFAIVLRNARDADETVTVVEPLPRWTEWELVESSAPGTRRDARHAEFEVVVPAGGQARLTYTVRYRWAQGARP